MDEHEQDVAHIGYHIARRALGEHYNEHRHAAAVLEAGKLWERTQKALAEGNTMIEYALMTSALIAALKANP
jgi:hypothetical protein